MDYTKDTTIHIKGKHFSIEIAENFKEEILFVADWCNNLPRKILGYHTPDKLFEKELDKIYAC